MTILRPDALRGRKAFFPHQSAVGLMPIDPKSSFTSSDPYGLIYLVPKSHLFSGAIADEAPNPYND
jgi:hypothetical protein